MILDPTIITCNFIVDSANGNGLGVRSVKGLVNNVYMHTSASPAAGNPNPAAGVIVVQLQNNFAKLYDADAGFVSPLGSSVTSTTAHTAYVITSLGTATAAQWIAAGVPAQLTPAVGLSFIAVASASIGGSATVAPVATAGSGIDHIEILGNANVSLASSPQGFSQIVSNCFSAGAVSAPADGTVISMSFLLSASPSNLSP